MATWQYEIRFIPRSIADQQPALVHALAASEEIDPAPWWKSYDKAQGLVEALSKVLPATGSWCDSIQMWGTYDGDRIEISWEGEQIEDARMRFDARQLSQNFIQSIVIVARKFDLLVLTEDMRVLEPTYQGLLYTIKSSNAARFVKDSEAFLSELQKRRS